MIYVYQVTGWYPIMSSLCCSNVKAVPMGMSRGVKKLIKAKVPNLGKYKDVSDFLTG